MQFSKKTILKFTNWNDDLTHISGNVVWTVAYNTSTTAIRPCVPQPCTTSVAGCPYDSLNVGTSRSPGAAYAGNFVDDHGAFINSSWNEIYCDDDAIGTGRLRASTNPPSPCLNTFGRSRQTSTELH